MKTNAKTTAAYNRAMAAMDALGDANMALFEETEIAKTRGTFDAEKAKAARKAVFDATEEMVTAYADWDAAEEELRLSQQ